MVTRAYSKISILKEVVGISALGLLIYMFIIHGAEGLAVSSEFVEIVQAIGVSKSLATTLVFVVGVVDILIASALVFYLRLPILLWAAVWPVVPNVLSFSGGLPLELGKAAMVLSLAGVVYLLRVQQADQKKLVA